MIVYHKPPFLLKELKIELTYRCPLSCRHCSSEAGPNVSTDISLENCLTLIQEAIEMGIEKIAFSGGEPLLWWPDLLEALSLAKRSDIEVMLYTSGNDPDYEKKIGLLKEMNLDKIIFSLFGSRKSTHEFITLSKGSFQRTIESAKYSIKNRIPTEFHFVPFPQNHMQLYELAQFIKSLGIKKISVLRFVPQGRGANQSQLLLDRDQNLELRKMIIGLRKNGYEIRTGSPYNFLMLNDQPACCAGIDRLCVSPEMKITPCDGFKKVKAEQICGTSDYSLITKNATLSDCWNKSIYLNTIRKYLTTPFAQECNNCSMLEKCLSGCLAQKFIKYGYLRKYPDPFCLGPIGLKGLMP